MAEEVQELAPVSEEEPRGQTCQRRVAVAGLKSAGGEVMLAR